MSNGDVFNLKPCPLFEQLPERRHVVGVHPLDYDFSAKTRFFGGCSCGVSGPHEESKPAAAATWNLLPRAPRG